MKSLKDKTKPAPMEMGNVCTLYEPQDQFQSINILPGFSTETMSDHCALTTNCRYEDFLLFFVLVSERYNLGKRLDLIWLSLNLTNCSSFTYKY